MFKFPKFLILIFLIAFVSRIHAQTIEKELFPILENNKWGYINEKGDVIIKPQFYKAGKFSNGLAPVRIKGTYGFINRKGKLIIDSKFDFAEHFSEGLARVWVNDHCFFINKEGEIVIEGNRYKILSEFSDGYALAIIRENDDFKRVLINKQGEIVDKKRDLKKYYSNLTSPDKIETQKSRELSFYCKEDVCGYRNDKGVFVWKYKNKLSNQLDTLNVDFMLRGYFYAFKSSEGTCNGCGKSANYLKKIDKNLNFQSNKIGLIVNVSEVDTFAQYFLGRKVYLYNTTKDTLLLSAQDSRIYVKTQALTIDGKWKDIEYHPSSWCGNSYHSLELAAKKYWEFTMPIYDGEFKTSLRLVFSNNDDDDSEIIYSNIFEGGVNPGQFWREEGYTPMNVMDPYLN